MNNTEWQHCFYLCVNAMIYQKLGELAPGREDRDALRRLAVKYLVDQFLSDPKRPLASFNMRVMVERAVLAATFSDGYASFN